MSLNLPVKNEQLIINPPAIMQKGVSVKPGSTTTVTAYDFDTSTGVELIAWANGTTVPGSEAGYCKGCTFIKTNAANGANCVYVNVGDGTTANFQLYDVSYQTDTGATVSTNNRLYLGTVTGGPYQVGEAISQATSLATAVVAAVGTGYIDINTIANGTFDATHTVTGGTSTATSTPTMTALTIITPSKVPVTPIIMAKVAGTQYTQWNYPGLITTTHYRFRASLGQIECLLSDSVSAPLLEYGA